MRRRRMVEGTGWGMPEFPVLGSRFSVLSSRTHVQTWRPCRRPRNQGSMLPRLRSGFRQPAQTPAKHLNFDCVRLRLTSLRMTKKIKMGRKKPQHRTEAFDLVSQIWRTGVSAPHWLAVRHGGVVGGFERGVALVDLVPVNYVPPGLQIFGAAVVVLEVVGVLPDVVAEDGIEALRDGVVLVGSAGDQDFALGIAGQPDPSAAELFYAGVVELG